MPCTMMKYKAVAAAAACCCIHKLDDNIKLTSFFPVFCKYYMSKKKRDRVDMVGGGFKTDDSSSTVV